MAFTCAHVLCSESFVAGNNEPHGHRNNKSTKVSTDYVSLTIYNQTMKLSLLTVSALLRSAAAFSPSSQAARVTSLSMSSLSRASLEEHSTPIEEGASVPSVTFKTRTRIESDDENPFDWKDVTSEDLFKGKKTVLFSLPGAFTPTCSSTHLPGYEGLYEEFKAAGVDEIYCLSVNDAFVMRQWGLAQG